MIISLTPAQEAVAVEAGRARQLSAEAKRSRPAFPEAWPGQLLDNHINAACAEAAVAVALGLEPSLGVDVYAVPDLDGTRIEVRWARNPRFVKVTPRDIAQGRIVVGTCGARPRIEILGWLEAGDAPARGRRATSPPPCWFIDELGWELWERLTPEIYRVETEARFSRK